MRYFIIFISLLLISGSVIAQNAFKDRKKQQRFVLSFMDMHGMREDSIESSGELDRIIEKIELAWASEVEGESAAIRRLGSYTYFIMGSFLNAGEWIDCYVWKEYQVPAFLEDFDYVESMPSRRKALLIRRSNVSNTFDMVIRCELPENNKERFYEAYAALPAVIARYLKSGVYANARQEKTLRSLKSRFERLGPFIELNKALEADRLGDAFAELAAIYGSGDVAHHYLLKPGKQLAYRFAETGRMQHAFSVLDLMARSNLEAILPRDTLKAWYTEISPDRGIPRFKNAPEFTGKVLEEADQASQLTGQYLLLNTGEELNLSALKGKIVVIDFWATWCVPCVKEIPRLNKFNETYGQREEVAFFTINGDSLTSRNEKEHVLEFMGEHNVEHPVILDSRENSLTKRFKVIGWPTKFVINPEGRFMVRPVEGTRLTLEVIEEYLQKQL